MKRQYGLLTGAVPRKAEPPRCWACNCPAHATNTAWQYGWQSRVTILDGGIQATELYCLVCFNQFGWPAGRA